mmetsp:Transcript_15379/g.48038  ORF Transcript_15379/g.48038 Transcript_15379/m.48038 type:complete len:312 (-) Transcript_15379:2020-2955(-)
MVNWPEKVDRMTFCGFNSFSSTRSNAKGTMETDECSLLRSTSSSPSDVDSDELPLSSSSYRSSVRDFESSRDSATLSRLSTDELARGGMRALWWRTDRNESLVDTRSKRPRAPVAARPLRPPPERDRAPSSPADADPRALDDNTSACAASDASTRSVARPDGEIDRVSAFFDRGASSHLVCDPIMCTYPGSEPGTRRTRSGATWDSFTIVTRPNTCDQSLPTPTVPRSNMAGTSEPSDATNAPRNKAAATVKECGTLALGCNTSDTCPRKCALRPCMMRATLARRKLVGSAGYTCTHTSSVGRRCLVVPTT